MDIDRLLNSEIHKKIIRFFHENQSALDTPRGIATWVQEERSRVKAALEDLVKAKILTADRATSTTGYSYTRDIKLIARVGSFLKKDGKQNR